jgi:hypothetical protein
VLAQPSPPSQGIQIGNPDLGAWDIRFSLTVTQCEPVPIYYNTTTAEYAIFFNYGTPDTNTFLSIPIPIGAGYIEWICNVPAGYGFYAVFQVQNVILVRLYTAAPQIYRCGNCRIM